MLAVVDLWVVLVILCITILFMCSLFCKISQMDAKMKNDHAEMLRVLREHNCNEKVEEHFTRFLRLQARYDMFETKEKGARYVINQDIESLKRGIAAQKSWTDGI